MKISLKILNREKVHLGNARIGTQLICIKEFKKLTHLEI